MQACTVYRVPHCTRVSEYRGTCTVDRVLCTDHVYLNRAPVTRHVPPRTLHNAYVYRTRVFVLRTAYREQRDTRHVPHSKHKGMYRVTQCTVKQLPCIMYRMRVSRTDHVYLNSAPHTVNRQSRVTYHAASIPTHHVHRTRVLVLSTVYCEARDTRHVPHSKLHILPRIAHNASHLTHQHPEACTTRHASRSTHDESRSTYHVSCICLCRAGSTSTLSYQMRFPQ